MHGTSRRFRSPVRRRAGRRDREGGQSLVEFALVLTPLFLVLLGIIQFGFIFNSYVTLTNAARESAREGSVYVYDRTLTKAQNDAARNSTVLSTLLGSLNLLKTTSPQLTTGATWTQSGTTFTNGDVTVTYTIPADVTDNDPRAGEQLTVHVTYHQDLLIPIVSALLPRDGGGRMPIAGEVTMVIN